MRIEWDTFPNQTLVGGLRRYVENRIEPGHFLRGVLENDLAEASLRADDNNRLILAEIAVWCYHKLPHVCRGSDEAVQDWLDGKEPRS